MRSTCQRRLAELLSVAALCGLLGCGENLWSSGTLEDPPSEMPLSNGLVVSLGHASFDVATTLLSEALAEHWPEGVSLTPSANGDLLDFARSDKAPSWQQAKITIHELKMTAGASGIELLMGMSLQPMTLQLLDADRPEDLEAACSLHVAFEHGTWTLPVRLTRSKLGSVRATAETTGVVEAELQISGGSLCAKDPSESGSADEAHPLHEELAAALVTALSPWISENLPAALGLDLATTVRIHQGSGNTEVAADVRTNLEEEATWWHWSQDHLVVGFDTRIWGSTDPCVADEPLPVIAASPIPAPQAARVWLMHMGNFNTTFAALWRSGRFCLDRAQQWGWTQADWLDQWSSLELLDEGSTIRLRAWPHEAPTVSFESGVLGIDSAVSTGTWTLEYYGLFQGTEVRLATTVVEIVVNGSLVTGSDRGVWLEVHDVNLERYEPSDGLIAGPPQETARAMISQWIELLTVSSPLAWLPPTPQAAAVNASVEGSYLVFEAAQ